MLRRLLTVISLLALLLVVQPADAAPELDVKAVFLAKFPAYVTWPSGVAPKGSVTLCTVGDDPFRGLLDRAAAGLEIEGRIIVVRRFRNASAALSCHVAYLGGSGSETVSQSLRSLAGQPVLTVTDELSSNAGRGMIHYVMRGGRVRFHIDAGAARRSGLTLKSSLLSVALSVKGTP